MSQSPVNLDALRQRAEQAIRRAQDEGRVQTGVPDLTALIEELRIYQAELEIQNQELVSAQADLAAALDKYRTLFESLPLPALLIDENGFITEANAEAVGYLNLSRFKFPRRMLIYQLFGAATRARLYPLLQPPHATGRLDLETAPLQLNDGTDRVCDLHVINLPEAFGPRGQSLLVLADQSARLALQRSEVNRQRHALANLATANAVWDWDLLTQDIWWSQAFEPLFGYSDGELPPVYETWQRCIHPDDRERVEEGLRAALAGGQTQWSDRYRFRRRDGAYARVEDNALINRDAKGRALRMSGAMRDVTEQTRVEEALQAQAALREQLDHLVASVPGVVYSYRLRSDGTSDFPYLSPRLLDVFGVTAESALADAGRLMALIHPDDLPAFSASVVASAAALSPWRGEFRIGHPHKGLVWLEALAMPVRQANGDIVWHGFMFDITGRKALEDASRQHTHLLEVAQEAAGLGYYVTDLETGVWTSSPGLDAIMGIDAAFERTVAAWGGLVHPDDRPQALAEFERAVRRNEPLQHQYRIIRPRDGAVRWVEAWGRLECEQERPARLIGTIRDITERKQAEERLRLSQFALQQASDAVYWIHPDSSIFFVNEAACRMLGYSQAELTAMVVRDLNAEISAAFWREHWCDLHRQHSIRLETAHRAKDGRIIPVEVSANYLVFEGREYNCAIVRDISQRKRYESQLKQSADRYRTLLNTTGDGFWLVDAATARLLDVNPAACGMSGYSREELLSKTIIDLDVQHSPAEFARHIEAIMARGFEIFETRHRTRDGRIIDVEVSTTHDPDTQTFVGFLRDITERKRTERELLALNTQLEARVAERTAELVVRSRELQESETRFRLAMEASNDGLWDWRIDSGEVYYSPGYFKMLGYAPDAFPCYVDTWLSLLHPTERERVDQEARMRIHTQGQYEIEFRMRTREGGYRWILSRGRVAERDPAGEPLRIVGTHVDITDRKEAELALRDSESRYRYLNATLEQKVEERTAQLAAASAAKSQFMAHMSHEMRTPMNAILGFAQILQNTSLAPDQREMTLRISEAGDSLLHLIDDILDLARIEAGQLRMDRQPFMLSAVLTRVDHLLRNTAEAKGLHFEIQTAALDAADALLGDASRLEQVLVNLLGNAIKFTGEGTVKLSVTPLSTPAATRLLRFEVEDTGIGIAPEVLDRLFQPFSQGDASITRRFGGTGLGLVISKRLVGLMGGQLSGTSRVGQGSLFWFEIPFAVASGPAAQPATVAPARPHCPELTGLRVLAVDDNRINLMVIERALKQEGARVTLAENGQQALDRLRAGPEDFDVVLMDIQMPVMDGLSATRAIRADPALASLPVVALSAGVLAEEREAAFRAGVNDFMAKPMKIKDMQAVLKPYLKAASEE